MERLTERHWRNLDPWECCGQDDYCKRGCHESGGCANGCIVPKLYDRLAAYEDTDLEPEEIEEHKVAYIEIMTRTYGPLHQKISKWLQAEKDGRLVALPCKPGTPVWEIGDFDGGNLKRRPFGVEDMSFWKFGTTVFLTREEAETALKKREEADNEAD